MTAENKYIAQVHLSHSVTGELIEPGHFVDLSHLTIDEIYMLNDMNAIRIVPADYVPFADDFIAKPLSIDERYGVDVVNADELPPDAAETLED